jgi:hypothetical protein
MKDDTNSVKADAGESWLFTRLIKRALLNWNMPLSRCCSWNNKLKDIIDAEGEAFDIQNKLLQKRIQQMSRRISQAIDWHQDEVMASVRAR